jgi:thiopurine S-methyltransferase
MEPEFWRSRWNKHEIGFHEGRPNALLVGHLGSLSLEPQSRIFLPLCGKTRDIHWLLTQGLRVASAELSELAITELFAELDITPRVTSAGAVTRLAAPGLDVFQGDFFDVSAAMLGPVDAIFDRAALVALPREMRARYAAHLRAITACAPQLLVTLEDDQSLAEGPPFSVDEAEVRRLHADAYRIAPLESADVAGGLKGKCPAVERAWRLEPRSRPVRGV